MDIELLARLQFAFTAGFHYIYPPLSIGLAVILVIMEGLYLKTGEKLYEQMTRFWIKIFALIFVIGVATGLVMEFEFGTNWASYSRFVGDVFGSPLAAEGIFAFFLESSFLAILVFGWNRVSPKMHFFSTIMVAFGSMLSALWIIVANSWMQTPAGYHIVGEGIHARAEITSFWEMVFNPSTIDRFTHTLSGCWLAGAFLVISISVYYLIKKQHIDFAKRSLKIALFFAAFAALFQLYTGHQSAIGVSNNQPAKLAAFEAHYDSSAVADLYLFGWVNNEKKEVKFGLAIPKMLTLLIYGDLTTPVKGLDSIPEEEQPPVNFVFQAYHIMVGIGLYLIFITLLSLFYMWRGTLFDKQWLLLLLLISVLGPQFANQLGWIAAEVGRQPWIVYGIMQTSEGISKAVNASQVLASLIMFMLVYLFLFFVFVYLLIKKIKLGPEKI
jgi:cytochrome d ubiquinol oxidase subunit I